MQEISTKVTGGQLTAAQWNEVPKESENVSTAFGASLSSGNLNQLGQAIVDYVASGNFYLDTGSATAYVLTPITGRQGPTGYFNGMEVRFRATNANSGAAPTVDVSGKGATAIVHEDATALVAGDISTTADAILRYDSTLVKFVLMSFIIPSAASVALPRGYYFGFNHINAAGDPTNDITVTAGGACRDAANTQNIVASSASPFTKRIDAAWAALDGNGGFSNGALVADTWYRFFIIAKADGTIDYGWDTNTNATTLLGLAAGFVAYRQIAWHLWNGTRIRLYKQDIADPSLIIWEAAERFTATGAKVDTTQLIATRAAPSSIAHLAISSLFDQGPTRQVLYGIFSNPDDPDPGVPDVNNHTFNAARKDGADGYTVGSILVGVDISAQVRLRHNIVNVDAIFDLGPFIHTYNYSYYPDKQEE